MKICTLNERQYTNSDNTMMERRTIKRPTTYCPALLSSDFRKSRIQSETSFILYILIVICFACLFILNGMFYFIFHFLSSVLKRILFLIRIFSTISGMNFWFQCFFFISIRHPDDGFFFWFLTFFYFNSFESFDFFWNIFNFLIKQFLLCDYFRMSFEILENHQKLWIVLGTVSVFFGVLALFELLFGTFWNPQMTV